MATELAKAYVQIIPSAQGIQGSITDALSGESKSAGTSSGKSLASSLVSSLKSTMVGLGIGKIITDGIADTSAFETGMAKVGTLFKGTGEEFLQLQEDILGLSSAYGISAQELTEAAYSAESAGVSQADLVYMLEHSAELAKAGFTDLDTALSATAKTMNAYGDAAGTAEDIQKVLIQTQNLGITTVGELGASLANVTPTAAAMGVSFEQVGAAMAELTATGVPTAQATTQLRAAMSELGKTGTKADKAFRAAAKGTKYAGMSFQEAMANGATLGDVFGTMQAYADKTGKSMVDLWSSVEAGNAAMVIAADLETFDENLTAMATDADVVGEAYGKMADTFGNDMNRLKESAKNFMTTLFQGGDISASFDQLLGSLGDVGEQIGTWLTNGLKSIGQNLPNLISSLWDFGGSIIDSLAKVDWIQLGVTIIEGIIGALGTLGSKLIELVKNAISAVVNGDVDFGSIGTAIWNGVVSIITTTGDWLKTLFETAKNAICGESGLDFGDIGTAILNGVKSVIDGAGKFLSDLFGFGRDAASGEDMNYKSIGSAILDGVKKFIDGAGEFLSNLFKEGISAVEALPWPSVGDFIKTGLNLVLKGGEFLVSIFDAGRKMVSAINWAALGGKISSAVETGLEGIKDVMKSLFEGAVGLIQSISWTDLGAAISGLVVDDVKGIQGLMVEIFEGATEMVTAVNWASLGGSISNLVIDGLNGVKDLMKGVFDAAYGLIQGIQWTALGTSISETLIAGLNGVKDLMVGVFNGASNMVRAINWASLGAGISYGMEAGLKGAGTILEDAFTAAHDFIKGISWSDVGKAIQDGLGDVWGGLTGFLGGVLGGAGDLVSGVGSGVGTAAEALGQKIAEWISGSDMKTAAEELKTAMNDMNTALSEGQKTLRETARGVGSNILTGLTELLAPETLVTKGQAVVSSVANGMGIEVETATGKVSELCDSMKTKFDSYNDTWKDVGEINIVGNITSGMGGKIDYFEICSGALMDNGIAEMNGKDWASVGTNIVDGIVRGINSASSRLTGALTALAQKALTAAKTALGIRSPSKVMQDQVGRWIPAGIAEGIEMYSGMVDDAMNGMATGMTGDLRMALERQSGSFSFGGGASGADTQMEDISDSIERQNALLVEQNSLLRRILDKDTSVRIGASAGLGRTVRQSLDLYNVATGR